MSPSKVRTATTMSYPAYLATYTNDDDMEGRVFLRDDGRIGTALVDLEVEADYLEDPYLTGYESGILLSNIYSADRLEDAKTHAEELAVSFIGSVTSANV